MCKSKVCNILLLIFVFSNGITFAQKIDENTKFFDPKNQLISKDEFIKMESKGYLKAWNDSLNVMKWIENWSEEGTLDKPEKLYSFLSEKPNFSIKSGLPLFIFYYPGKDRCNSSGSLTSGAKAALYRKLEKKVTSITPSNFVYVYKNKEGLKAEQPLNYQKDPEQVIEHLFFPYHYPCFSYVIVMPDGRYYSKFGEYSTDNVLHTFQYLKTK